MLNSTTINRIKREIKLCSQHKNKHIEIIPCVKGNMSHWKAFLLPGRESIYSGMKLGLEILIPDDFPYYPPLVVFTTPVFHPNIGLNGGICTSTLADDWSPALTIENVLLGILSLLDAPNPSDPVRIDAAELYEDDRSEYFKMVRKVYDER
ncbi:ubiquitin-conjugating enzyme E2 D [Enteropsectra breve]|nr:ubiquitin-conjugating enzyme E2 D [Enteropsectra breve]